MMKVVVIINAAAGSVLGKKALIQEELFHQAGIEAEIRAVEGNQIVEAARAASITEVDAVVAGGGDGTISSVAGVLCGTKMPLGVLPLGTLNHFAKDIGIPLDIEEAVKLIANGRVKTIDVAEVNNHIFINNSSIGLYPNIIKGREEQREQLGLGKWPAMFLAALDVFRRFPVLNVRLEIDGCIIPRSTPFVFVGNNEYQIDLLTFGGRLSLDKGKLSLFIAKCTGRLGLFKLALSMLLNRLEQTKDFDTRSVDEVWLETRNRLLRVSLDGEVVQMQPPLHYRALPKALRVILPP